MILPLLTAIAVAVSATPAVAAISVRWHAAVRVEPARNGGLSSVSCPSAKLCVAVDQSGWLVTSKNPAGNAKAWTPTIRIDKAANGPLTGISCPTTSLCVAVDASGNVITSTNPTGGRKFWSGPVHVDSTGATDGGSAGFAGISCPTVTLCVAVDAGSPGNIVTSTRPTGGASAWKTTAVNGLLTSVSCVSNTLCVAAGSQHYVSTSPTGGTSAWHATGVQTGGGIFSAIDCPSASLCVATGYGNTSSGLVTTSGNPRGSAATWTTVSPQPDPPNAGSGLLDGVACMSNSFCLATDSSDNVFTSTRPSSGAWGASALIAPASGGTAVATAVSCAPTLCVVVDSNGYAIAATKRT